jgi:hypothetical protein
MLHSMQSQRATAPRDSLHWQNQCHSSSQHSVYLRSIHQRSIKQHSITSATPVSRGVQHRRSIQIRRAPPHAESNDSMLNSQSTRISKRRRPTAL